MKENKKGQSGEATAPEGYHRPNFLYQVLGKTEKFPKNLIKYYTLTGSFHCNKDC